MPRPSGSCFGKEGVGQGSFVAMSVGCLSQWGGAAAPCAHELCVCGPWLHRLEESSWSLCQSSSLPSIISS